MHNAGILVILALNPQQDMSCTPGHRMLNNQIANISFNLNFYQVADMTESGPRTMVGI